MVENENKEEKKETPSEKETNQETEKMQCCVMSCNSDKEAEHQDPKTKKWFCDDCWNEE